MLDIVMIIIKHWSSQIKWVPLSKCNTSLFFLYITKQSLHVKVAKTLYFFSCWYSRNFAGNSNFAGMWNSRALLRLVSLLNSLLLFHSALPLVSARGSNTTSWNTLSGSCLVSFFFLFLCFCMWL